MLLRLLSDACGGRYDRGGGRSPPEPCPRMADARHQDAQAAGRQVMAA
jgi:hypothetical protein